MSVRRELRTDPSTGRKRTFWMIDVLFNHPDGSKERIRKVSPVQTRRKAEQFERDLRESLFQGRYGRKEAPLFKDFAKDFIETYAKVNNKPSEVMSKESMLRLYLLPAFGDTRLDRIGVLDIDRFKARLLDADLSPKTVNNSVACLGKILRYAQEIGAIEHVPRIRLLKVPDPSFDFLTFEEAGRVLKSAEAEPEWRIAILFCLRTGVRWGEQFELRWGDIDLTARRMDVKRSYSWGHVVAPKNNRTRSVPLSPQAVDALKGHRHLKSDLVFCNPDGSRISHRQSDGALRRACRRAGLREIGWHVLRHTFASHLVMNGKPLKAVQELLGHQTLQMTLRYAHLSPETKSDAVRSLDAGSWQPDGNMKNLNGVFGVS